MKEYSQDFLDTFGGPEGAEWIDLHYEVMYAKYIYYDGVKYGFKPMPDERYDIMESRYKDLSSILGKEPGASSMVGWTSNALIEAMAMRHYDENLYDSIKHLIFEFK
jgi:hypothetical protein